MLNHKFSLRPLILLTFGRRFENATHLLALCVLCGAGLKWIVSPVCAPSKHLKHEGHILSLIQLKSSLSGGSIDLCVCVLIGNIGFTPNGN